MTTVLYRRTDPQLEADLLSSPQRSIPLNDAGSFGEDAIDESVKDASAESVTHSNGDYELPYEECWLYRFSKKPKPHGSPIVPIEKWLREVFDSPTSVFSHSKRNLLTRLELILVTGGPIAAYRFGGSVPTLNLMSSAPAPLLNHAKATAVGNTSVSLGGGSVHLPSTGSSDSLSTIGHKTDPQNPANSLAFSRVLRPKVSLPPQRSGSQHLVTASYDSSSQLSQSLGSPFNRPWSGSTGKVGSCDALETTKANVQEIARIQEDILKADVAALAAAAAGRLGSQTSLGSNGHHTPEGSLSRLASAPGSPCTSNLHLNQSNPSLTDCTNSTNGYATNASANPSQYNTRFGEVSSVYQNPRLPLCTQASVDSLGGGTFGIPSSIPNSCTNSMPKHAYPVLPPKPFIPSCGNPEEPSAYINRSITSSSVLPEMIDNRSHFGFRPARKISTPHYATRPPPLPAFSRRVSAANTHQMNK
ncbi:hypothetical protein AHF37_09633 [Paragonimus kellicotti]|nr:hypothetical protein AHF37_09633 [Paragonimus kellicotti]